MISQAMSFEAAYRLASEHGTLVGRDRALVLWEKAHAAPAGEFWECGVYRGGSAYILAEAIRTTGERCLRLFDTFSGLPEPDEAIDRHQAGEFKALIAEVSALLNGGTPIHYVIHRGKICDSIAPYSVLGHTGRLVALAHLDLDLYHSTANAIDLIWPLVVPGGALVCDDYRWEGCPGVTKAIEERFPPERITVTGPMQCVIAKE